jgi:nucleoid-associated protein EbfC
MAGIGDLANIMQKAKQMQQQFQQVQEQLRRQTVEASSGGGVVTATVNGAGDLISLKINPDAVKVGDVEMLEDLIVAAVNAAIDKSRRQMQEEMSKMTSGLNLPGLDQIGKMFT